MTTTTTTTTTSTTTTTIRKNCFLFRITLSPIASILVLYALIVASPVIVVVDGASLLANDKDPNNARLIIEYNDHKFIRIASEYAVDGQIREFIQRDYLNPVRNISSVLEFEYGNNTSNNMLSIVVNSTDDSMINRILQNPYVNRVERDQILTTQVYSESLRYVNLNENLVCNNEDELNYINRISTLRETTATAPTTKEDEEDVTRRKLKLFGNDKGERIPYGIEMVQGTELWSLDQNNRSIEVCVVDTGYNAGHEDLPTVLAKQVGGTNTGAGVWFNDGHGHGTHCSGIICAVGNNDIGVVGIREKPTLNVFHAGKGLADDGSGFSSNIMSAVQGCVDDGAKVISLSLGGYKNSSIERAFYDDIYNQGILVVAAAGNSGNSGPLFPGSYPSVISVSAVDQNGIRPDFSQCNNQVEIVAPGVDIMSTFPPNTYATLSGTSMAGPHVAGIAAQLMSFFPECTNYQIRTAMVRSADSNIGEYPGYCNNGYGSGLVQGKAAYDLLSSEGCAGAGGPYVDNPAKNAAIGGCEQNPDYVATGNSTYRNVCPGAQLKSSGQQSATADGILLVSIMVVISILSCLF